MDNKSATNAEAAPCVIKDTTSTLKDNLENQKKDMTIEKKISDAMEIMEGFGVRLQKMEKKMEEKMDLLISLIKSNNEVKTGSVKAEAESVPMDESSSDEEYNGFGRFVGGYGRGCGRGPFIGGRGPYFGGRGPPNLFVGGRFGGGRCGGQGYCAAC